MSVHQLKDGRWFVQYRNKEKPGKFKRKYFGKGLDAERKARDYNESLGLRSYENNTPKEYSVFFIDLVNSYAEARLAHLQESTLEGFMYKMSANILPFFGNMRAMSINDKKVDGYIKQRLKKVKKTTIHRELSDIKAVLNWAVRRRYIAHNPIEKYDMPKKDNEIFLYPSQQEINAILKHAPERLKRAISLSYYTGLRPGRRELFSLNWNDVDFIHDAILVRSARKGGRFKSRLVPIHPDFTATLKSWYDKDDSPAGPIIHYQGKRVGSLKKVFASAKKKAGVTRRLRMYDFRHAFASLLLKNSADLKSTSELLGHSRTETTTKIYQHTDSLMHRAAVGKLPKIDVDNTLEQQKCIAKIIPFKRKKVSNL
jgi:integrase